MIWKIQHQALVLTDYRSLSPISVHDVPYIVRACRTTVVEPRSGMIHFIQLFGPSNMSLGCYVIAVWESKGEGIQWSNLGEQLGN